MIFKLVWFLRHLFYKFYFAELKGFGYIGPPSFYLGLSRIKIKSGFGIFPGWRIEVLRNGQLRIGNNVRIGNNFFLSAATEVTIGSNVTFSANVYLGTTKYNYDSNEFSHFKTWETNELPIIIEDNCFLGYGCVVLPGTVLERGCIVGANAVVSGRYKAGSIIAMEKPKVIRSRL